MPPLSEEISVLPFQHGSRAMRWRISPSAFFFFFLAAIRRGKLHGGGLFDHLQRNAPVAQVQKQRAGDYSGDEAPPDPARPEMCGDAQAIGEREADEPVRNEVQQHGNARVMKSAQRARGADLQAVAD